MKTIGRRVTGVLLSATFVFGACGNGDVDSAANKAEKAAERVGDEVADGADDAKEVAGDAFATFRTGFERLVDEASSGDVEAKEKLLDECRDTLEKLRKQNDPRAERTGALCQKIRDADDGNAWKEINEEYEELKS